MSGALGSGGNRQAQNSSIPTAPTRWPACPDYFNDAERQAWERLKAVCKAANTIASQDFIAVEYCARIMAKVDVALNDPTTKLTALNSLMRLVDTCLKGLGLTPASRRNVSQVQSPADPDDELAEFI